jgi:hypothetical protein
MMGNYRYDHWQIALLLSELAMFRALAAKNGWRLGDGHE